jgi:hypothetical protein
MATPMAANILFHPEHLRNSAAWPRLPERARPCRKSARIANFLLNLFCWCSRTFPGPQFNGNQEDMFIRHIQPELPPQR